MFLWVEDGLNIASNGKRQQQVQQMQLQEHLRAVWNSVLVLSVHTGQGLEPWVNQPKMNVFFGHARGLLMYKTNYKYHYDYIYIYTL